MRLGRGTGERGDHRTFRMMPLWFLVTAVYQRLVGGSDFRERETEIEWRLGGRDSSFKVEAGKGQVLGSAGEIFARAPSAYAGRPQPLAWEILETFFLMEEKHAMSVQNFHEKFMRNT